MNNILMILPIIVPVFAGLLAGCIKNRSARNVLTGATLAVNALLVLLSVLCGAQELTAWQLTDTVSIYFHVDGISKLFALLISCMWLCVGFYSFDYM